MAAQNPVITAYQNQTTTGSYDYTYASLHELAWQPGSSVDVPEFKTDIYPAYYKLYGDGFRLITFLYAAGLQMPGWTSSRKTVFEEPELEKTVELDGAVVAGGVAGADIDLVIALADSTYPLEGRSIYLPGEYFNAAASTTPKEYVVTNWVAGTRTATVSPLTATTTHDVNLPDGLMITVGPAKFGRGQGQPQAFRKRNLQRDFYVTILGETKEWEGGVNTYQPELGVIDSQGHKTLFDKGLWETEFILERSKDKTIWLSEYNTNSVTKLKRDGTTTSSVESFVGLRNHLDDRAQQLPYIDTIEPQDLKKIREIYESQAVMADMSWGGFGPRLWENMQDSGLEFIRDGYTPGTDLFKNLETLGAQFKVIDLYGHKLVATELKTFADMTSFGNSDYNFQNEGFIIPMSKFAVRGEDGVKVSMNNLGIGYRKGNNENRTMMNGIVAGVNGMGFPFVDQFDATSYYMKCEFGLVALGVNQWINVIEA